MHPGTCPYMQACTYAAMQYTYKHICIPTHMPIGPGGRVVHGSLLIWKECRCHYYYYYYYCCCCYCYCYCYYHHYCIIACALRLLGHLSMWPPSNSWMITLARIAFCTDILSHPCTHAHMHTCCHPSTIHSHHASTPSPMHASMHSLCPQEYMKKFSNKPIRGPRGSYITARLAVVVMGIVVLLLLLLLLLLPPPSPIHAFHVVYIAYIGKDKQQQMQLLQLLVGQIWG